MIAKRFIPRSRAFSSTNTGTTSSRSIGGTLRNLVVRLEGDRGGAAIERPSSDTIVEDRFIKGPFAVGLTTLSSAAECRIGRSRIEVCRLGARIDDDASLILDDSIIRRGQRNGVAAFNLSILQNKLV